MTFARAAASVVRYASQSKALRFALASAIARIADAPVVALSTSSAFGCDLLMKDRATLGHLKAEAFALIADHASRRWVMTRRRSTGH